MPNLTSTRAAHEAHFAHRERREVVVQHKALRKNGRIQQLNPLLVVFGAKGRRDQSLRLTAREQRRSMRPGQNAHFAFDVPDFIERPTIRSPPIF